MNRGADKPGGENRLKERLGPGFWIDENDNLHVSLLEIMDLVGLEETPANREAAAEIAQSMLRQVDPRAIQIHREGACPKCKGRRLQVHSDGQHPPFLCTTCGHYSYEHEHLP